MTVNETVSWYFYIVLFIVQRETLISQIGINVSMIWMVNLLLLFIYLLIKLSCQGDSYNNNVINNVEITFLFILRVI